MVLISVLVFYLSILEFVAIRAYTFQAASMGAEMYSRIGLSAALDMGEKVRIGFL